MGKKRRNLLRKISMQASEKYMWNIAAGFVFLWRINLSVAARLGNNFLAQIVISISLPLFFPLSTHKDRLCPVANKLFQFSGSYT